MFRLIAIVGAALRAALLPRAHLVLENLALRQQVAVLARKRPRPALSMADRAFWVVLRRVWSGWTERLIIVRPETVVRWHRAGFRLFWAWKSRRRGRPRADREIRDLIRRMATDNPGWGAPRIHGELLKLGFSVAERTVSRYLPHRPANPEKVQRWLTFLRNHANVSAAMDFFVVPTATFRVLYGFFVIGHGRRRILHFNATSRPTAAWVIQQLREAFPEDTAPRHLLFDRDAIFSAAVVAFAQAMGTEPVRSAYRSPWQNPVAERWIGSCRRELLDHVVVFGERHRVTLVRSYLGYYHDDRTHLGLGKGRPRRPRDRAEAVAARERRGAAAGWRAAPSLRVAHRRLTAGRCPPDRDRLQDIPPEIYAWPPSGSPSGDRRREMTTGAGIFRQRPPTDASGRHLPTSSPAFASP